MLINKGDTVLFQGDSITDCHRHPDNPLGEGYPFIAANIFSALYPEMNVTFINRGISGNRVKDLSDRWQEDCLDLKPDVLSILVGVNDTWHRYSENISCTAEEYKSIYRDILIQAREKTNAKLILMEPFLIHFKEGQDKWREDLNPKIMAVRELALEFNAVYIPLDGIFASAIARAPMKTWVFDGIHPTPVGHALIAKAWLDAMGVDIRWPK